MQFDLIRLVLVSRSQTSLFEERSESGETLTREEWLRRRFGTEIAFNHRTHEFHYIPDYALSRPTKLIIGQIGRQFKAKENLSPEEGFKEVEREPWRASNIIIDPKQHADGQKLAFEVKDHVGSGLSIIQSLCNQINTNHNEPYIIEANAITDPKTFWDFESTNRGSITTVTFDLVAPNMFGIRDDMDKEMAEFRDNEKARNVSITLKNPDGLKLDEARVKQAVSFATEGGGRIKARAKDKIFDSNKNVKRIHVGGPNEVDNNSISSTISSVITAIFGDKDE